MTRRLASVLLAALALAGATAVGVRAFVASPSPVLGETLSALERANVPPGMVVVFLPPSGDGFSDGGDGPGGLEWVLAPPLPDGFSDGGDVPEGFVASMAQPVGEEFWRDGTVPDGLLPVLAWPLPNGFSDGGDLPEGFIPVLLPADGPIRGPSG
jgi:hypothetical protein